MMDTSKNQPPRECNGNQVQNNHMVIWAHIAAHKFGPFLNHYSLGHFTSYFAHLA